MVASRIASIPGASTYFRGSVVAYASEVKGSVLGVPDAVVEAGVVTEETAKAMAEGAAERLGVDVAVATTGEAGPDPAERPVGTLVIAVRTPETVRTHTMWMPGDRERVRTYAATAALHLTRLAIVGEWWPAPPVR
jgi:nicotinamide-nucleotide amidase